MIFNLCGNETAILKILYGQQEIEDNFYYILSGFADNVEWCDIRNMKFKYIYIYKFEMCIRYFISFIIQYHFVLNTSLSGYFVIVISKFQLVHVWPACGYLLHLKYTYRDIYAITDYAHYSTTLLVNYP